MLSLFLQFDDCIEGGIKRSEDLQLRLSEESRQVGREVIPFLHHCFVVFHYVVESGEFFEGGSDGDFDVVTKGSLESHGWCGVCRRLRVIVVFALLFLWC